MSSRSFSKALRPLARQLASPAVQRRTFVAAAGAVRASAVRAAAAPAQQVRGVKTIDFAGSKEDVYGELRWINWLAATNC
jgi:ketol-acid reductoisomerase